MSSRLRILVITAATVTVVAVAGAQPPALDPLAQQQRLEARLAEAGDLTGPQRAQMEINLAACRALGLAPETVDVLFPGHAGGDLAPATALRLQSEVIRAARGELPLEPLLAKIREGRMKGVPDEALVAAGGRVLADLESAAALLDEAGAGGLAPPVDAEERRNQLRILSRAMWRGLTPEDGARLRVQAQARLEHGPCATADLAAAAETVVRIREQGGDREDALRLAGTALAQGYTAPDLAELGHLVTAGRLGGGDMDALLADLTARVDEGLAAGALNRYLSQSGWMGPADAPGAGGRQGGGHQGGGPGDGGAGGSGGGDSGQLNGSGAGSTGGQQGDGGSR